MTGDDRPPMRVPDLFDPEPQTWGLRGDPYLWRALRAPGRSRILIARHRRAAVP
jgi:hypothetical protein